MLIFVLTVVFVSNFSFGNESINSATEYLERLKKLPLLSTEHNSIILTRSTLNNENNFDGTTPNLIRNFQENVVEVRPTLSQSSSRIDIGPERKFVNSNDFFFIRNQNGIVWEPFPYSGVFNSLGNKTTNTLASNNNNIRENTPFVFPKVKLTSNFADTNFSDIQSIFNSSPFSTLNHDQAVRSPTNTNQFNRIEDNLVNHLTQSNINPQNENEVQGRFLSISELLNRQNIKTIFNRQPSSIKQETKTSGTRLLNQIPTVRNKKNSKLEGTTSHNIYSEKKLSKLVLYNIRKQNIEDEEREHKSYSNGRTFIRTSRNVLQNNPFIDSIDINSIDSIVIDSIDNPENFDAGSSKVNLYQTEVGGKCTGNSEGLHQEGRYY